MIVIEGEGYEYLFNPGDERNPEKRRKLPVRPYAVIAPRLNEFHQHFNTGRGPFRQLAFKGWDKNLAASVNSSGNYDPVGAARSGNPLAPAIKLRYDQEDPRIREEYYGELERNGINLRLEPIDQGPG